MLTMNYNREEAVAYAHRWAYERNPQYYDFGGIGGDCTNFVSQCVLAGGGIMNHPDWFYYNISQRSPSWTGTEFLYRFLTDNKGIGPFGKELPINKIQKADIVQLKKEKATFSHTMIVVETGIFPAPNNILVASHTYDVDYKPLSTYEWAEIRFIHILDVRKA